MATPDHDRFRLRRFVERLAAEGDAIRIEREVALADLALEIESTPKAVWLQKVGPERLELVAGVSGERGRIAKAFECDARELRAEIARRLSHPQEVVETASSEAPVHARILTGEDIDLTRLPFYLQHEFDAGPYISSAIDFSLDPASGKRNIGCRRLMLRSKTTCRTNLTNRSDLRSIYLAALERREPLPVSFAIGSHPIDFMAGVLRAPGDEFAVLAALRGAPTAFVRGASNGVLAPADTEIILEGYLDAEGYREMDGPYGEFWGYYGPMHLDPVFHVTAIAMRSDALHQSVAHGGRRSALMETNQMSAIACELAASRALASAGIEPAALFSPPGATLFQSIRVALRQGQRARAREAIAVLFKTPGFKQVVVVDDDVDIFDEQEIHWAMSTRFRGDRDLVVAGGLPAFYEDPTADAAGAAKTGFDLTAPGGWPANIQQRRTAAPIVKTSGSARLLEALARGPMYFADLMRQTGSRDGRELAVELGDLCERGRLKRLPEGEYALIEESGTSSR